MKPIRISTDIKQFASSFYQEIFTSDRPDFVTQYDKIDSALDVYDFDSREYKVLRFLKIYLKEIQLLHPEDQATLIERFEDRFGADLFYTGRKCTATDFSNKLIEILRYDRIQDYGAAKIAEKLNLKACPYCNAAIAVTVPKNSRRRKARFQLDHYFPKSKYPYLSSAFFNLIPSCGNCNQTKSNSDVDLNLDFHLYAASTPENAFKFELDNAAVIKSTIGFKREDIKFKFQASNGNSEKYAQHHNKSFDIQGIYDTQKDVIEELIWKSQAYTDLKVEDLGKQLKVDSATVKRMVIGNYTDYEDIHKRPLAKFMQDIASDLDLL